MGQRVENVLVTKHKQRENCGKTGFEKKTDKNTINLNTGAYEVSRWVHTAMKYKAMDVKDTEDYVL